MKKILLPLALALCAGCWTFDQSVYPESVDVAATPEAQRLKLQIAGFEATYTELQAVSGFQTFYNPGYYGRYHYHPGYFETVPVTTYVANERVTDHYLKLARDRFEKAGYALADANADRIVEVTFSGPFEESGDTAASVLWPLCTVFFCDYGSQNWSAQLRIRDAKSGRLVFHHDYVQRYETKVFGLIPLFGIACCDETGFAFMKSWCLSALTARAVADATAFLASAPGGQPQ